MGGLSSWIQEQKDIEGGKEEFADFMIDWFGLDPDDPDHELDMKEYDNWTEYHYDPNDMDERRWNFHSWEDREDWKEYHYKLEND